MEMARRKIHSGPRCPRSMIVLLAAASALPLAGCEIDAPIGRRFRAPDVITGPREPFDGGIGENVVNPLADDGGGGASDGQGGGSDGDGGGIGGAHQRTYCVVELPGTVRDFKAYNLGEGHPDFEADFEHRDNFTLSGIVEPELGPDGKPVYAPDGPTLHTSGREGFDQWYRDVPDVNKTMIHAIPLRLYKNGTGVFDSQAVAGFFPADDKGWGNEDKDHNYGFTYELHTKFQYGGGDLLNFAADDDLWVFINGRLALDLGGLHGESARMLDIDAVADELGIEVGEEYPLDIFYAERRSAGARFMMQTSMDFEHCGEVPVK